MKEPNVDARLYRTYFKGILDLVSDGRKVDGISFAGSIPPENDLLWRAVRKLGIKPNLHKRAPGMGEADATDHLLQLDLLRLFADKAPDCFALLTGDGAGYKEGKGFLADAERLVNSGWKFELYSWETVCHGYLRKFAEDNGKFIRLEDYYQNITFIKGGRQAVPLKQP